MAIKNRIEAVRPMPKGENATSFFKDLADALPSARGNLSSDDERKAFSKYSEEDQIQYLFDALPQHVVQRISTKYPENWKKFKEKTTNRQCQLLKPFFKKMDLS